MKNTDYLIKLSFEILSTLEDIYKIKIKYNEYKNCFRNELELNIFFNSIHELIWMKFCNQMRDLSKIIFKITKNNEKYFEIKNYIENTTFLNEFLMSAEKFSALSFALHNYNYHDKKQVKNAKSFYEKFNNAFLEHKDKIQNIKSEFEEIIFLITKIDESNVYHTSLDTDNFSKIFGPLDYLCSNKK